MPKEELWVGTADPDPRAVVGSAGSCDSMISNDSSQSEMSDGGYEHLSVEEKECLMFLQETLDSLDHEADSGLSTDEAEIAELSRHPQTWPKRDNPKELDQESLGKHQKNEQCKKCVSDSVPVITSSGYHSLPRNVVIRQVSQPNEDSLTEARGFNDDDPKILPQSHLTSQRSLKLGTVDVPNDQPSLIKTSDLESVVIPPPEPFQDQWRSHSTSGQESPPPLNKGSCKDLEKGIPYHSEVKRNIDIMESLAAAATQQQFSPEKAGPTFGKQTVLKPQSPQPNKKITENAQDHYKKPTMEESALDSSFKQGPPTAPKPRKLPPNIILKTSKSNAVSLAVDSSHKIKVLSPSNGRPRAATGDFSTEKVHCLQKEQDRARREALEKLGLPQDKEKDPDDQGTQNSSVSKSREPPRTSSRENVNVDNISVNKKPEQQHNQVGGKGIHTMEINIPGVKQANFKSNTLERSGVGLSSYVSSGSEDQNIKNSSSLGKMSFLDKISPSFLRNNRPRTASLGMGKDFTDLKENRMQNAEVEKIEKRRSYPLQSPAKLPRPPCVSVKITPKGAADEHRKEALKKLGLLKE
ncbi:specifically androgen-regulated gene protein [Eublepharis macularius]|uniref:Specifically androgen-regulated gene protein n=1 Tax=Eublepharis macularius TaxID=481883 RepID=A0AA97JBT6_EUBMA|nr:specifically androgen-regulated gene protein [Eublepharis macularius]XP_054835176.1 specifically androgen-regulated gene protein [Eublepharis macularius]XP_054835177.1 specifically androgen-regulated gene protein [Eublepharis macularius]XP_054835178.1 specifically androgen-regulated gene protein [Eublepharis macularius]